MELTMEDKAAIMVKKQESKQSIKVEKNPEDIKLSVISE
jgi:hypothetical protein